MAKAKETLSEKTYIHIYDDITGQRLVCGQKLTLKSLSEMYGVSFTPIREALSRLSENGLVSYYSNCGVKVIDFTDDDIIDLYRFASELDALAVSYCSRFPLQDALRQALRENAEAGNRALSCGEIAEWEEHSKQFHKIFYAYAQSPCLDEADAKLRPRLELLSCIYYQSASREKINKEHNEILRLVLDNNFEAAQKLMRTHLECDMLYAIKGYHAYKENL